jgi:hypothetical protein
MKSWLINWAYNFDRFAASLLNAPPQETISSQCGRALLAGKGGIKPMIARVLDYFFPGHTEAAIKHADFLNWADSQSAVAGDSSGVKG